MVRLYRAPDPKILENMSIKTISYCNKDRKDRRRWEPEGKNKDKLFINGADVQKNRNTTRQKEIESRDSKETVYIYIYIYI